MVGRVPFRRLEHVSRRTIPTKTKRFSLLLIRVSVITLCIRYLRKNKRNWNKKEFQQDEYRPLFTVRRVYVRGGGLPDRDSLDRDPCGQTPARQRPLSWQRLPLDRNSPEGTWDQAAGQEVTLYRDPFPQWTEWLTDFASNFVAGGKKSSLLNFNKNLFLWYQDWPGFHLWWRSSQSVWWNSQIFWSYMSTGWCFYFSTALKHFCTVQFKLISPLLTQICTWATIILSWQNSLDRTFWLSFYNVKRNHRQPFKNYSRTRTLDVCTHIIL